jgi:hypothetical protein
LDGIALRSMRGEGGKWGGDGGEGIGRSSREGGQREGKRDREEVERGVMGDRKERREEVE